jgi:hypothetical protein
MWLIRIILFQKQLYGTNVTWQNLALKWNKYSVWLLQNHQNYLLLSTICINELYNLWNRKKNMGDECKGCCDQLMPSEMSRRNEPLRDMGVWHLLSNYPCTHDIKNFASYIKGRANAVPNFCLTPAWHIFDTHNALWQTAEKGQKTHNYASPHAPATKSLRENMVFA